MIGKWENCLSVALTKSTASSVGDGCQMMLERGTKNFGMIIYILSGNRCIFASMLKCTSLARPCASVAYYQTKFQVPLASIIRYPRSGEQYSVFCQTLERLFLSSKEKLVS